MERREITVQGIVQGVGFRPFVHGLASQYQLNGFVKNRAGSVLIEVEGEGGRCLGFWRISNAGRRLCRELMRSARNRCQSGANAGFALKLSDSEVPQPGISSLRTGRLCRLPRGIVRSLRTADTRYPFLNCTRCGPRLTIIQAAPYDRRRTTMAGISDVPGVPSRVRKSCRPPLSCPTDGLSRMRPPLGTLEHRLASESTSAIRSPVLPWEPVARTDRSAQRVGRIPPRLRCPATKKPSRNSAAASIATKNPSP